jgi:beta-xylosidase
MPTWADFYFWAPEITYDKGKVYVYYAAHKKGGNLCVGVASADQPEGPYKDHGPLICQTVGSIDAFPMRDEKGKLHLIWKEDANSVNKPTPIWIQELNEERTALVGEKKELFRNNAPWEGNLVEGVSMLKHGDYFYAFYAAAGCCGTGCTYASGVARSKKLEGPWEKYAKNPILVNDEKWKCPGHGTPIEKDGKYYFLYHAYDKQNTVFTGRQGLLVEFKFTPDGWIEIVKENSNNDIRIPSITDDFKGKSLSDNWQWSVFQKVDAKVKRGRLELAALPAATGAVLGQKTYGGDYEVTTEINKKRSTAMVGLGAIGDEQNSISVLLDGQTINIIQVKNNNETTLLTDKVDTKKKLWFQMQVHKGKDLTFLYSTDGLKFYVLNEKPIDGSYLPPWDRAVRAGLISKGKEGQKAVFERFQMLTSN